MAMMINNDCIDCGACVTVCPNDAINEGAATDVPVYWIDAERCTECVGAHEERQCIEVCPVDCIVPNPDCQETQEELLAKYQRLHE
ncbi:MAG: YfhL family 4Fe-4S dicluster ferredoxin [Gemmatimonadota bacterium]|nr:MAG: YfhL family 4Fe-4S dicluster ferredoxin [Gemmatimonadota bacterium]